MWDGWGKVEKAGRVSQAFLRNLGKVQDGAVGTLASAHGGGGGLISLSGTHS